MRHTSRCNVIIYHILIEPTLSNTFAKESHLAFWKTLQEDISRDKLKITLAALQCDDSKK